MTTAATTAAARRAATPAAVRAAAQAERLGSTRRVTPERTTRRTVATQGAAPRRPRRVSGPARPASPPVPVGGATHRPAAPVPTRTAPAAPSAAVRARVAPGPSATTGASTAAVRPRPGVSPRRAVRSRTASRSGIAIGAGAIALGPRVLSGIALAPPRLARLRLEGVLDRIVRGRAWIPLLAVLLIGIVAMQVEVLKLGASVGRSMNLATELAGQIQGARAEVSAEESPARIEALAGRWGLRQPGPTDNHFVSAHTGVGRAIAGIHPPNPAAFAGALTAQRAAEVASTPAATPAAGATTAAGTAGTAATAPAAASTGGSPLG